MKLWISSQGAKRRSGYLMMARVWLSAGSNPDSQGCSRLISVFPHPSSALLWSVSLTLAQPVNAPCSDSFVCILTVCCFANLFPLVSSYEHLSLLQDQLSSSCPPKCFAKTLSLPHLPFQALKHCRLIIYISKSRTSLRCLTRSNADAFLVLPVAVHTPRG